MSPKTQIAWGGLAVEMISIVIAVGLGFAVSEWREDRRQGARADDAVSSITRELATNHAQLAQVAPYYRQLAQSLDSLVRVNGDAPLEGRPVPGWRGLSPPILRQASYLAASNTGAMEHVPFEIADRIAGAYEIQGSVSLAIDQAMGSAIDGRLTRHSEWVRLFSLLGEITAAAEQELATTLTALDSNHAVSVEPGT